MKNRILEGALIVFKSKGLKFTMDDLASELSMSKKTIYTVFDDKNQLLCDMVDYTFDAIKAAEDKIYYDDSLTTVEKIQGVLGVLPESYNGFGFETLYQFADKYPKAYEKLNARLENGWEQTRELLKKGIAEGTVKDIDLDIFQLTYEASIERLIMSDILEKKKINYPDAFRNLVEIMVNGIIK